MFRSGLSICWLLVCLNVYFAMKPRRAGADDRVELSKMLRDAADELDASTLPTQVVCAAEFAVCATQVTDFLTSPSFKSSGSGWLDYLRLAAIGDAIESDVDVQEQIELMGALRGRLVGPIPGVELAPLVKLRERAECYRYALICNDKESFIDRLRTQLVELASQLEVDSDARSTALSAQEIRVVSQTVTLLSAVNQSTTSVERIRSVFAFPNCVITLSEGFVQQAIARSIAETRPIDDCILGTHVVGQANIHADVTVDLQPSSAAAQLTVNLHSRMTNQSRGYHGPVTVNMVGGGESAASRTLLLSDEGVTLQPVRVQTILINEIQSIEHPLRIVRRIARRRADEQKPESDQIAKSKIEAQIRDQFTKQTDSAGAMRPDDLLAPLRPWFRRFAVNEPRRTWGSTDHSMFIQGHLLQSDQLASPLAPPACSAKHDVAIQVHETCANHVLAAYMSGKTLSERSIDLLAWLNGRGPLVKLPIGVEVKSEDKVEITVNPILQKFQIVLAVESPVFFEARAGRVVVGAHVAKIVQDGMAPISDVEVRAIYLPRQQSDGHFHLARESKIQMDMNENVSLSKMQHTLLVEVREAIQRMLPMKIADQDFLMPTDIPVDALKDRHFRPSLIDAQDGWLTIAVR